MYVSVSRGEGVAEDTEIIRFWLNIDKYGRSLSNVFYLFKRDCGCTYVGRTIQRLEERIKQHVPKSLVESVHPGNNCSSAKPVQAS